MLDSAKLFLTIAPMSFYWALFVWLLIAAILVAGVVLAVSKGIFWLMFLSVFLFVGLFAKYGCAAH